jgi:hypothetical protein
VHLRYKFYVICFLTTIKIKIKTIMTVTGTSYNKAPSVRLPEVGAGQEPQERRVPSDGHLRPPHLPLCRIVAVPGVPSIT